MNEATGPKYDPLFAPVSIVRLNNGYVISIDFPEGGKFVFNTLGDRYGKTFDEGGKQIPSVLDWIHEYFSRTE
jgi:hypothetical protein